MRPFGTLAAYIHDATAAGRAMLTAASAAAQTALLDAFVAAGGSNAKGLVPAPGSTAHTNNPHYLGDNGSFNKPLGRVLGISYVVTGETTNSTTAVDLTTTQSISFTLQESCTILFTAAADVQNDTINTNCILSLYGGSSPVTLTANRCTAANAPFNCSTGRTATLSAGSYTYNLRFSVNAGNGTFSRRLFLATIVS